MGTATKQQKKVPELRFGGFGDQWTGTKLGKLGEIVNGLTYSPDNVHENGVLVLRSSNVQGRKLSFDDCVHVKVPAGGFNPVMENDILICVRNGSKNLIGKNALITKEAEGVAFGAFMSIFRSDSGKFLFQWFDSDSYKKQVHQNLGATINSINGADLRKFKLAVPNLEEQQKIADFLGSVDAWLDNHRQQKTALETYKRGMMQKLFTQQVRFKDDNGKDFPEWKTELLGKISKITTGSSNREGSTDTGKYRLFDRSSDERWSSDYELDAEALIVAGEGLVFKPKYYSGKFALHQRAYAVMSKDSSVSWRYLFYFITFNHHWFRRMSVGTTMPSLRMDAFTKMEIVLPIEPEQQKIADFLSAIDQAVTAKSEEISKAEQWKKGLMQKMFV